MLGVALTAPATFGDETSPLQRKKFPPRFRQLRRFDFAGNATFKLRLKRCARSINYDHVLGTF